MVRVRPALDDCTIAKSVFRFMWSSTTVPVSFFKTSALATGYIPLSQRVVLALSRPQTLVVTGQPGSGKTHLLLVIIETDYFTSTGEPLLKARKTIIRRKSAP